jgi:hypothetical protein
MFRLGTREAKRQVVVDSAPVADDTKPKTRINQGQVVSCVDLVRSAGVELSVADDGRTVTATGDPLEVGYVLGRLMAALAADDLHATVPQVAGSESPLGEVTAQVFISG